MIVTDGATPSLARRLAGIAGVTKVRAEKTYPSWTRWSGTRS